MLKRTTLTIGVIAGLACIIPTTDASAGGRGYGNQNQFLWFDFRAQWNTAPVRQPVCTTQWMQDQQIIGYTRRGVPITVPVGRPYPVTNCW